MTTTEQAAPAGPHLIYFADPMCSWCWGFAPVIAAIAQHFGPQLPIRLVLGGLRPGTTTPLTPEWRASLRTHWHHVEEASGQKFDLSFFERDSFIYDTEPAARAVVVMRRHSQAAGLAALHRLQQAFYAENTDITDPSILTRIAAELGFDPAQFAADFDTPEARTETVTDFAISQDTGIAGFPTLIAGTGQTNQYAMVTKGYQDGAQILPALAKWLARLQGPAGHA